MSDKINETIGLEPVRNERLDATNRIYATFMTYEWFDQQDHQANVARAMGAAKRDVDHETLPPAEMERRLANELRSELEEEVFAERAAEEEILNESGMTVIDFDNPNPSWIPLLETFILDDNIDFEFVARLFLRDVSMGNRFLPDSH